MDAQEIIATAQEIVRSAERDILSPQPGECLLCFTARQLTDFGCNGEHRFATIYRDRAAPRATALLRRLARMGACCCDCEIFMNAYALGHRYITPGYWYRASDGTERYQEPRGPDDLPQCHGVRRGSTQPCGVWERRYQVRYS